MPHRFSDRLGIYPYFAEVGLERFDFSQQPKAVDLVVQWLTGWIERLFEKKNRPGRILGIWGPNGTGKTTLALSIAKFHLLNVGCSKIEFVNLPLYIDSKFNGGEMIVNWQTTPLIILDDFDAKRFIPKSFDTWLVDSLAGQIKTRSEIAFLPTIMTSNRNPLALKSYLSQTSRGESTPDTQQAGLTLSDAIKRNMEIVIPFNPTGKTKDEEESRFHFVSNMLLEESEFKSQFELWEQKGGVTLW